MLWKNKNVVKITTLTYIMSGVMIGIDFGSVV